MNKMLRKILLIVVLAAWSLLCEFGFLMAYFAEHDLLAGLSVIAWFVALFIFSNDIERGLK